jgi:hypothetical protein
MKRGYISGIKNQKYVLNSSDASGGKLAQYYGVPATTETVTFVAAQPVTLTALAAPTT